MPLSSAFWPRSAPRLLAAATVLAACAASRRAVAQSTPTPQGNAAASAAAATAATIPPDAAGALARLNASPRHGEYATVRMNGDSVRAWVVYPQRSTKAPVVVVVHEIFGLSTWVRAVADQLAADGYIAIAPDLLTGYPTRGNPDSVDLQGAIAQVSQLDPAQVQRRIAMAAGYAMALPSAEPRYGVVGFCWGGSAVFQHAVYAGDHGAPGLRAVVVYYGSAPKPDQLQHEQVPILGLFGGEDARVTATLPPADSTLRALGRPHEFVIFPGAGHGFLRQQNGPNSMNGANHAAAVQAWPRTVRWFARYLGRR